jgi:hypothetical protein
MKVWCESLLKTVWKKKILQGTQKCVIAAVTAFRYLINFYYLSQLCLAISFVGRKSIIDLSSEYSDLLLLEITSVLLIYEN